MTGSGALLCTGSFPLLLLPGPYSLYVPSRSGGGGGGNRRDVDSGVASDSTLPAYIKRRRAEAWLKGRCGRTSCFSERVVVMLGKGIASGRSGIDVVKRMMRYMSCSGRAAVVAMAAQGRGRKEKSG